MLGFDDSLDVVGIHLVGGLLGTLYLGFFATGTGFFLGGGLGQLTVQAIAGFGVLLYCFVVRTPWAPRQCARRCHVAPDGA